MTIVLMVGIGIVKQYCCPQQRYLDLCQKDLLCHQLCFLVMARTRA